MQQDDWENVEKLFHQVLEQPSENHAAFIDASPLADTVKREVSELLKAHLAAESFLEDPVAAELITHLSLKNSDAPAKVAPGQRLGSVVIEKEIGQGSFGQVYLGEDEALSRKVAVKVTPETGFEAQTLAQLQHPHIISVYSQTCHAGWRYVFMQYIDGLTLAQCLRSTPNKIVTTDFILQLSLQISSALSFAHKKGILHLDVKPENIFLDQSGAAFLGDFNISMDKKRSSQLQGGTPKYMAPEQRDVIEGRADHTTINETADIYSFGLVLQELIQGEKESLAQENLTQIYQPIIDKCLRENQTERFEDGAALNAAIISRQTFIADYQNLPGSPTLKRWLQHNPLLALLSFIIVPNVFGSLFNIGYNDLHIVSALSVEQRSFFRDLLLPFNLAIFTLPVTAMLYLIKDPINFALKRPSPNSPDLMRQNFLLTPLYVARALTIAWFIGMIFWPSMLYFSSGSITWGIVGHFCLSFLISWLISLSYAVLLVKFFILGSLYPRFLIHQESNICTALAIDSKRDLLVHTRKLKYLSGAVPMIAMVTLIWTTNFDNALTQPLLFQGLASGLAIGGLFGLIFSVQLSQLTASALNFFRQSANIQ